MSTTTLAASALVSLVIATVYMIVGRRLLGRPVQGEARDAMFLFATWWFALAAMMFLDVVEIAIASFGVRSLGLFTAVAYVNLFLTCLALIGLLYYLAYLFTGWTGILPGVIVFYTTLFLAIIYTLSQAGPAGVSIGAWTVSLTYATALGGPWVQALLFMLLIPPMLGAIGYLTLLRKVQAPTQRYRIALVSASILMWFGSVYGASLLGVSDAAWWPVASSAIGLVGAVTIWAAYVPPGWIRDRLGVKPLGAGRGRDVRPDEVSSTS